MTHHSPVLIARVKYLRQGQDTRDRGREIEPGRIHMVQTLDVVEVELAFMDGQVPDLFPTRESVWTSSEEKIRARRSRWAGEGEVEAIYTHLQHPFYAP